MSPSRIQKLLNELYFKGAIYIINKFIISVEYSI